MQDRIQRRSPKRGEVLSLVVFDDELDSVDAKMVVTA
jgi:hypothetical protein